MFYNMFLIHEKFSEQIQDENILEPWTISFVFKLDL